MQESMRESSADRRREGEDPAGEASAAGSQANASGFKEQSGFKQSTFKSVPRRFSVEAQVQAATKPKDGAAQVASSPQKTQTMGTPSGTGRNALLGAVGSGAGSAPDRNTQDGSVDQREGGAMLTSQRPSSSLLDHPADKLLPNMDADNAIQSHYDTFNNP